MAMFKPKFKLGQKVKLFISNRSWVFGYVIGIKLKRSYESAGLFQAGGLDVVEIALKGFVKTYLDNIDDVEYSIIYNGGTTFVKLTEKELIQIYEDNKNGSTNN